MTHYYEHNDINGDIVDITPFCSDWCHQQWCAENGMNYEGWNGCHEQPYDTECAHCEEQILGVYALEYA